MNSHNLENLLADWGRSKEQLPTNNTILKNSILNRLPTDLRAESRKTNFKMPWLPLTLGSLAVLILVVQLSKTNNPNPTQVSQTTSSFSQPLASALQSGKKASGLQSDNMAKGIPQNSAESQATAPSMGAAANALPSYHSADNYVQMPPTPQEVPITDNRQFLKTDYSAAIQSHHVQELTNRVQTTIRGFDGRIDANNTSEESSYLSFVLPADKLDAFRQELKSLAGGRFITEQVQTENMLPQKRDIESQQQSAKDQLAQLNTQKTQLIQTHTQTVASLQSQINTASRQLANLQNQPDTLEVETQKQELANRIKTLRARLADENANYKQQKGFLDSQIQGAQTNLDNANTQNSDLLDNVATVRGAMSISYVSLWDILNLYLGVGGWLAIFLGLAAVISYFATRRNKLILP